MFNKELNQKENYQHQCNENRKFHVFNTQVTVQQILRDRQLWKVFRNRQTKYKSLHSCQDEEKKRKSQKTNPRSFKIRLNNKTIFVSEFQNKQNNCQKMQKKNLQIKKVPTIKHKVLSNISNDQSKNVGDQKKQVFRKFTGQFPLIQKRKQKKEKVKQQISKHHTEYNFANANRNHTQNIYYVSRRQTKDENKETAKNRNNPKVIDLQMFDNYKKSVQNKMKYKQTSNKNILKIRIH